MASVSCRVLTVLVHGRLEALGKPAGTALVTVGLIYWTAALQLTGRLARVHPIPVDAAFEEP